MLGFGTQLPKSSVLEPRFWNDWIFILFQSMVLEPRFQDGVFGTYVLKSTGFGS
jgi:hypothetical protein